ncbi:type IV pilus modification PilV family protein [Thioalkalivibrio paradoxus]|uniref:Prepilin-type N-terminal cleavage/methylation domain-containing protein n=1 Tax=Thioalkalivibrio paradoxus ARh 1 TaxID=713585 RepID=W0DN40_9GAMM|nr:hypothetical protein [Thioalkalivibrio paradoxus]AHE99871.1 hypothetical protein THITH_02260 [Thioalkalivibrio paradoxus ARh 1]
MNTRLFGRIRGITLMEALIALVVVSLGLLALARFYGDLISSTGESKARTEAVQFAASRAEQIRTQALGTIQCDALKASFEGTEEPVVFANASIERKTEIKKLSEDHYQVQVTASWVDAKNASHSVDVTTEVVCDHPTLSAAIAEGGLPGGGMIAGPSGRAEQVVGRSYGPDTDVGDMNVNPDGIGDGTRTHTGASGATELIDQATGDVLLEIKDGTAFSTIEGRVFIKGASPDPDVVRMIVSAEGYCTTTIPAENVFAVGNVPPDSNIKYQFLWYRCYVGGDWHGNIDIYRTDGIGQNDEFCVGDPEAEVTSQDTSRHPQLGRLRTYRGFEDIGEIDADGEPVYYSVGILSGEVLGSHDFLVVRITGQPDDSDCYAQLRAYPDPYDAEHGLFVGNQGKRFCLTEGRGSSYACPPIWPVGSPPVESEEITIAGDIIHGELDLGATKVVADNGQCVIENSAYSCVIRFTGVSWSGYVRINTNHIAEPLYYEFEGLSDDSAGNDFTLSEAPPVQNTKISGIIERSSTQGQTDVTGVSIEEASCASFEQVDTFTYKYTCFTSEWTDSWAGIMTLAMGNQNAICETQAEPAVVTGHTSSTVSLANVNVSEVTLNIAVHRTAGQGDPCPDLTD